jgi:hypothetical protein
MTNSPILYTQEQLDIAILKNTDEGLLRSIYEIKTDMKSQFHLLIGLILGIYGIITASAVAKVAGFL